VTKGLVRRLLGMFTGALAGYMWGWIWGWSLFDPNSDIWALAAGAFALLGLLLGAISTLWRYGGLLLSVTCGLYLSWIGRTLLFGDVPGGIGALFMLGGVAISNAIGIRLSRHTATLPVLLGALYIGFFGGFIIDVVLIDKVLKLAQTHSIVSQAPAVLVCGIVGGIATARWSSRSRTQVEAYEEQEEHP
jgi:hypothetical protein